MVEPPSRRLQQILLGLKLCSPRDLRRCASRVKTLSADLPAFDSVWLDALVQRHVLTSWQAQTIELDLPELLKVGPCIVEDRIGQSHHSATYLARLPDQKGDCVIKRVSVPSELRKSVGERLNRLVERSRKITHPGIIVPHSFSDVSNAPLPELTVGEKLKESAATRASRQKSTASKSVRKGSKSGVGRARRRARTKSRHGAGQLQSELAIVSRFVDGLSLSEILLRRGRLPAADVDVIARQLLESLAVLHDGGIVHGEILLSNIRLLASGQAVLVDAGLRGALQPEFQINAHVAPEKNDGVAPELIGTGAVATPRSDLYALGFALWQLLAGRPAFPTGDSLAKLAAHQTERIPDIREFAPDTPDRLAKTIEWLTEPVPARRPRSAGELLIDVNRDRSAATPRSARPSGTPAGSTQGKAGSKAATQTNSGKTESEQQAAASRRSAPSRGSTPAVRPAGRTSRRRLARFAASFQQPLRRSVKPSSARRTAKSLACATAAVLIALAALFTFDPRSRRLVLASLPQRLGVTDEGDARPSMPPSHQVDAGSADRFQADVISGSGAGTSAGESTVKSSELARHEVRQHPKPVTKQQSLPTSAELTFLPLPEPDPYGVVVLSEPGTYEAGAIIWPGSHLTLRGLPDAPAQIVVTTKALQLRATEVTLENVEVRLHPQASKQSVLSQIRSQKLTCFNGSFLTPLDDAMKRPAVNPSADITQPLPALAAGMAIQWDAIDASDPLAGDLAFHNCRLVGSHSSIMLRSPARMLRCLNTLKVGGGPLVIATDRAAYGDNIIELEQSTLRQSGSVVALDLRNGPPWRSRLTIRPRSSVFDLKSRSAQEAESLVTFVGGQLQLTWHERVGFEGDDSVAGGTVGLAAWQAANGSAHQVLDAAEVSVRGLIQTDFTFINSLSPDRADSILADVQASRISSQLPGISATDDTVESSNSAAELLLIGPETSPNGDQSLPND